MGRKQTNDALPTIALAGNPNVGKSTVFNALTGMRQHTGNWTGKTVASAEGVCRLSTGGCRLADIPGTYSLRTHSAEEEVARDRLTAGDLAAVVVVCDATCLTRGVGLVLQILEMGHRVAVCVNLMDEAARRGLTLDLPRLERRLGIPVVGVSARRKKTLAPLRQVMTALVTDTNPIRGAAVAYPSEIENEIQRRLPGITTGAVSRRYAALCQMEAEDDTLTDPIATAVADTAERLCRGVVRQGEVAPDARDRRIDRVLTSKRWGYPLMLLLLMGVLWLTLYGTNRLSDGVSAALAWVEGGLCRLMTAVETPPWLYGAVVEGAWRMLATVVAVMLPPMAVFFPLFTLLEDVGYLPRVAYNLDRPFARCGACGKQALTMCMGFGCNAAGVVGCRIIDSPRERLMAVLTNSFVPCNGRFPALILLIALMGVGGGSFGSAALLTGFILLGIGGTFGATALLNATLLRGTSSFFTLELPPYRPPRVGQVILRSVLDRTLFVLGRAAAVAAPAGLVIWVLANTSLGGVSLLHHAAGWLDPLGRLMGMDGVILLAFVLGLPANEVVLPLAVMLYTAAGTLPATAAMGAVLTTAGWTPVTALCVAVFTLFHWPCSTTLLTVKKETGSVGWTAVAAVLPTVLGVILCMVIAAVARIA